jgi:hypothetical protein
LKSAPPNLCQDARSKVRMDVGNDEEKPSTQLTLPLTKTDRAMTADS